jgi:hypothetical protein
MKGRQKGRPTKWVSAEVKDYIFIGKPGVKFEVWEKWKKKDRKVGTLIVSVGGVRWRSQNGRFKSKSWKDLADWFEGNGPT